MSASNTAFALRQNLPAHPKWLFVMLTECAGAAEYFDLDYDQFRERCGFTEIELERAVLALNDAGYIRVAGTIKNGWKIQFTYPGEFMP